MFKAGSNEPILCDFGIAHFAEDELFTVVETKKGDRMANFQYAAPEQRVKGGQVSEQADVYAVALILNEMFTGEIPQASGYKTIASIDPEYKFLDEVFDLLYQQDPMDRLYPEEKILTETKVRAERHKRDQEKKHLQEVVAAAAKPDTFEAVITKKEYSNGSLVFTFNKALPAEWFQILTVGNIGTYTSLVSYRRENLKKKDRCTISMPLHGYESNDTIKKIVEHLLDWVAKTNVQYSVYLKDVAEQAQREAEAQRREEIERLEKENAINDILSQI
jgi:serine/threonine protein kinase